MSGIFVRLASIQMHDLRWVRQYLLDEAVFPVSSQGTTTTLFSEVYPVSTCTNSSVFKIHSGGLSQIAIDTHELVLFSKNCIGCQSNFSAFSKLPLWSISFFILVTQTISVLICLFIVEEMAQDTTAQIRDSWRLLNTTHLYTNQKNTLVIVLLLMLPQFGLICLMIFVLLQLLPVSGIN